MLVGGFELDGDVFDAEGLEPELKILVLELFPVLEDVDLFLDVDIVL